jgi:hypothetical protein
MPKPDRPKVGEADPETRRKKLRELLDQPSKATGVAPKKADEPESMLEAVSKGVEEAGEPKPKKKKVERRYGPKGKSIDEIIED